MRSLWVYHTHGLYVIAEALPTAWTPATWTQRSGAKVRFHSS